MNRSPHAANIELLEEIFSRYQKDPSSVDPSWKTYFDQLDEVKALAIAAEAPLPDDEKISRLIEAYRTYGHLQADVDPIATEEKGEPEELNLENLGFRQSDLEEQFSSNGLLSSPKAPLKEIVKALKRVYCGTIGFEFKGLENPRMEAWLQERIEKTQGKASLTIEQKKMILQYLNKSELFEVFLHTKYTGQKRFSLEGGETLIPIMAASIQKGAELGAEEFVIGMAHRGRLNVLSNILNKSYAQIFSEFEEGYIPVSFEGTGDVKYHKGFSDIFKVSDDQSVKVHLAPNPSHLESVNPVVEGEVYAKQALLEDEKKEKVIPLLIHGDAAISGQGVVYETLQLSDLPGYGTGGTVHLIINNQIGFTTHPQEGRSTRYCSDIAKTFNAPVFHVNGEDPESCVFAAYLAMEARQKFHCEVFIDLNCWRKYGHNEADEPAFTQPLQYEKIRQKEPIREHYRDELIQQGVVERKMAEALEEEFKASLQEALTEIQIPKARKGSAKKKEKTKEGEEVETSMDLAILKKAGKKALDIPEDFAPHRKLQRLLKERLEMAAGEREIDWGMGETLTYASLLWDGVWIRLAGQDSQRGTFSHRHLVWMDQKKEHAYFPLRHLKQEQGKFELINSPLTEYAGMGFEYGYSLANPSALVVWEAQFGDFCNGAQIIIDQYLATSEQKWNQKSGLVLLLPHGYEGQGPEHSSGRMERFLALAGNENLQIVNPTSPAQFFHLLRRQILTPIIKPLIIFTPKGLLRHPECVSSLEQLAEGKFHKVIDDPAPPKTVKEVIFCSGKIYYELAAQREKEKKGNLAICRIEQLYPLDREGLEKLAKKYRKADTFYWVQEEPENMGGWDFIRPNLRQILPKPPEYVGRQRSASPAAGSFALHQKQHQSIMDKVFKDEKRD